MRDCANIQVIWYPDNLVPDKGSRFREGGIKGDQNVLIGKTRCTKDGLAPTTLANQYGEADSANGMFPNDIIWLLQIKNTQIWPQKGAECELNHGTAGSIGYGVSEKFRRLICSFFVSNPCEPLCKSLFTQHHSPTNSIVGQAHACFHPTSTRIVSLPQKLVHNWDER